MLVCPSRTYPQRGVPYRLSLFAVLAEGGEGSGPKALEHGAKNKKNDNEVKFGKHLASSDKRVRDRTVAALREWLRQRSRGGNLTDLDLLKVRMQTRASYVRGHRPSSVVLLRFLGNIQAQKECPFET